MAERDDIINQLLSKQETLLKRQDEFSKEIYELSREINRLKFALLIEPNDTAKEINKESPTIPPLDELNKITVKSIYKAHKDGAKEPTKYNTAKAVLSPQIKSDIEKFIGENLINKIGIAITVIGVAIGAKYSIEHQLISPLTRIILGYLCGLGLLGFGIKLKRSYNNYSAVLVSGAVAILYFITYSAYSFYSLIPQAIAFGLMVVFTAFSVVAAIKYDQKIIAHIGLVGAYAVPFLLSNGSGKVAVLFSYMAIINIGILFIAFKKYWKSLYYSAFFLTWLIFFSWFATKYRQPEDFVLSLIFLFVFFATFYLIFLAYKLLQKEKFEMADIVVLIANSFIFYGFGYAILSTNKTGEQLLGLFTLGNAIIHFCVTAVIYKQKLADRNLFFLVAGMVLVFITIAIPVQLDGNYVTLLWACEAASLFWIGRTKDVPVYEKLSYLLMFLAFFSIVQDWSIVYDNLLSPQTVKTFTPIFNIHFLSSFLFIGIFTFINHLHKNKSNLSPAIPKILNSIISFSIPAILLIVIYFSFRMEIAAYWDRLYSNSEITVKKPGQNYQDRFWDEDLTNFKNIWIINYSLLFFALLSFVNIKKIKNRNLGLINIGISGFFVFQFLTLGLPALAEFNTNYINPQFSEYYHNSIFNIGIRYISFALVALMLRSVYEYTKQQFIEPVSFNLKIAFDLLLHISILCIACSELISWMKMMKFPQSYQLGLSILWGIYALLLIALGIWKKKKHLRIGAIVLFGITLVKLFFYDIAALDTIAKTIVFVSLGVLLLIISFLYNKYKYLISNENEI